MREYTFHIEGSLRAGLRPDARVNRNTEYLFDAFNVRCTEYGLEAYDPITDPFGGGEAVTYPWPQIVRGDEITLLFGETSVSEVDETVSPWTSSPITTVDTADGTTAKAITGSGQWHFIDMKKAWYAFNGTTTVFRTGLDKLHGYADRTFAQNAVSIQTGCEFNGRAVIGGFNPANFWDAEWQAIFAQWRISAPSGTDIPFDDVKENVVFWSSIGGGDFPLWLFYPDVYGYDLDKSADRAIEMMKRNEFGFLPLPSQGTVLCVKKLGPRLAVYTEDAVHILQPYSNELASGFGLFGTIPVGCAGRDTVGGDDNQHVFISTAGDLYRVGTDGVSRLGYGEYLASMLGNDVRISFNSHRGHYYINDDTEGYILTPQGLTRHKQFATSGVFVAGAFVGLFDEDAGAQKDYAIVVSNPFDMRLRTIKTVTGVSLAVSCTAAVEVAIDYRYEKSAAFQRTRYVQLNKEGNAYIRAAGLDFRVVVRTTNFADIELDSIQVKWQSTDKRTLRGPAPDTADI